MNKWKTLPLACCAALAWLSPSALEAANINVPADYATIGAAVAAAATSDTITITNSAVYPEAVTIDKRIKLMATAGQNPVIQGDGVATFIIRTAPGANGAQVGSNDGGRIILDPNNATGPLRYIAPEHSGGAGVVTFENLLTRNPPLPAIQTMAFTRPINCAAVFQDIEINGSDKLHLVMDCRQVGGLPTVFNRVYVHNLRQQTGGGFAFYSTALLGDLTLTQCDFTSYREFVIIDGGQEATNFTLSVDRSYISSTVNGNWDMFDARYNANLNITNSILDCKMQGTALRLLTADNTTTVIDHCDFFTTANHAIRVFAGDGRSVSVTNCNFSTTAESAYAVYFDAPTTEETYVLDYNNADMPSGTYYGWDPGTNDITPPVTPAYYDVNMKSYITSNPELIGTGEGGSNIGAFCDFFEIYLNMDPCPSLVPEPPTSAGNWAVYM